MMSVARSEKDRSGNSDFGYSSTKNISGSHLNGAHSGSTSTVVSGSGSVVHTWGRAKNFRLGRRHVNTDSRVPERVDSASLSGKAVLGAACGGGHTCVLLEDHSLRVFGYSQYGQLGVGDRIDVCDPVEIRFDDEQGVCEVSCGRYHTLALTVSGRCYSWGGGKNGRLGHGDERIHTSPTRIEALVPHRVVSVACGYHSNLALTNDGKLYSWGWGAHGQLGHGTTDDCLTPQRIESLVGLSIAAIACGDRHSFAITREGQLFGWGSNEYNQLGTGKRGEVFTSPVLIKGLMGLAVKQVSSGDRHTTALTNLGAVYSWGCGSDGQIGHGDFLDSLRPRLISQLTAKIVKIQCGHNFTLALTDTHELYAWGNNVYGQLGNGGNTKSCSPVPVSLPDGAAVRGMSCAHFHCVLWTNLPGSRHQRVASSGTMSRQSSVTRNQSNETERKDAPTNRTSGSSVVDALTKLENSYSTSLDGCGAELGRLNSLRQELIDCIEERFMNS